MKLTLIEHINMVLFEADLLNTSCVANEAKDEYKNMSNELHYYIPLHDYVMYDTVLAYVLREALSLDDEDVLTDYVPLPDLNRVVNDLNIYLTANKKDIK